MAVGAVSPARVAVFFFLSSSLERLQPDFSLISQRTGWSHLTTAASLTSMSLPALSIFDSLEPVLYLLNGGTESSNLCWLGW